MSIIRTSTPAYRAQPTKAAAPQRSVCDWAAMLFRTPTPDYRAKPVITQRDDDDRDHYAGQRQHR